MCVVFFVSKRAIDVVRSIVFVSWFLFFFFVYPQRAEIMSGEFGAFVAAYRRTQKKTEPFVRLWLTFCVDGCRGACL